MEQLSFIKQPTLELVSNVKRDAITDEIAKNFDYEFNNTVVERIEIPTFPKDFDIGVIVGSSGSGKSTIMRHAFGEEEIIKWDNSKSIASNFQSFEEASKKFGAVGLNSIPTWVKPYNVLSNGEKFRADLARRLHNYSYIDEFTSVVNREVAISCSCSIEKYIRGGGLHNLVFCSCHDDILPFLKPQWVYNTDTHELYNGRYLQRTKITIKLHLCRCEAWSMFKKHHYLSGEINKAAQCYMATLDDIPIAFIAILSFPGKGMEHAFREHRVVVLPDYQGMGIGNKLSETIAQAYLEKGCRYFCKTSNPRMGEHRDKSSLWRATAHNHKDRHDTLWKIKRGLSEYDMKAEQVIKHAYRVCYAHEYIGDGTKYPYTYTEEDSTQEGEQLTFCI